MIPITRTKVILSRALGRASPVEGKHMELFGAVLFLVLVAAFWRIVAWRRKLRRTREEKAFAERKKHLRPTSMRDSGGDAQ